MRNNLYNISNLIRGGFLILVDLLNGIGVGADGARVGVWLSLVWGV